jgi:transposase InsO family protein
MSWGNKCLMELRKEFILQVIQEGSNVSALCKRYNISRKTGYKWIQRHNTNQTTDFSNFSTRPKNSPEKTAQRWIEKIIGVRTKHPAWGARKIWVILSRSYPEKDLPACSTIHKILQQQGYISEGKRSSHTWKRFEHDAPNRLWQMDFKGHFAYEQGRCHPLTILDDHSRFSVLLKACTNEKVETVRSLLIEAFKRYGLPERINVDNGSPWGSFGECSRYTNLSVWLIRIGVKVSYSRPRHPQTNGKDERFHRTLKREVLESNYFRDIEHIQINFDKWRDIYNIERPHEALGVDVPINRFKPSYRSYSEKLDEIEYAPEDKIRKVDQGGRIHFEGRSIFVGSAFIEERIGIREISEGIMQFFYSHQKLGELDLRTIQKNTTENLYNRHTYISKGDRVKI